MNIKSGLLSLALAAGISNSVSGALVAAWDLNNAPSSLTNPQPPAWDSDDHAIVSNFTMHGSITGAVSGSPMIYAGWGASIDTNNYVGFTVKAEQGYQLNLTDLAFVQTPRGGGDSTGVTFNWGYRIAGGAWVMMDQGGRSFTGTASLQSWNFDQPIVTTEEVEIGFFATVSSPTGQVSPSSAASNRNDISLNGSVVPVPEASTALLGLAGAMAGVLRRRKPQAC